MLIFQTSWQRLGGTQDSSWSFLGPFSEPRKHLGSDMVRRFEQVCRRRERVLGCLGASVKPLGGVLRRLGAFLGRLGGVLGGLRVV